MGTRRLEILGLLLITVSILVLISLIGFNPNEEPGIAPNIRIENPMGILGVYSAHFFIKLTFGYVSFILPLLGVVWGWWFFSHRDRQALIRLSLYLLAAVLLASITIGLVIILSARGTADFIYSGLIGGVAGKFLFDFLGMIGAILVILTAWLVLFRGYFSWSFYTPFRKTGDKLKAWLSKRQEAKQKRAFEEAKRKHTQELLSKIDEQKRREETSLTETFVRQEELDLIETELGQQDSEQLTLQTPEKPETIDTMAGDIPEPELVPPSSGPEHSADEDIEIGEMVVEEEVELDKMKARKKPARKYRLPMTNLLIAPVSVKDGMTRDELIERANFLTQSLATFGVEGKVVNVHPGPVITLFEVEPAEGVRVNKFVQLSDDLARVMEASRVRVIAPIPGKSSVGIEIPNRPATVYFKSVINSEKFAQSTSKLTLAVGKTTSGEIATLDLAKMPHLLIAGTTGSGKSVCLNTIICSLLYQATPEEVKFIIIDPKKVEMTLYRSLKGYHLLGIEDIDEPIVTTMENAILALRALEKEMDQRYNILAEEVVRNIDEYNERMKARNEPLMPYIVLVIDELADLMMMSAKDVEVPIARLAQLSRAVGIHLVIATQRPSVDVITGVIKANFPARIAFQVATKIDSRTILDTMGAEKLIGRGDMLYLGPGSSEPVRLHNAFITLDEIEAIMEYIKTQPQAEKMQLASIRESATSDIAFENGGEDELFREAIRLVITHQQGSISLLQRRLKVGYSRAARLIDQMEQLGIVGPFTGSKAREVLVDELYLQTIK
ncbi:MAG: DNA translocase FtsK [FCB group bacterium]|nr:DNA translocase FtsK [FCB group bacterium]